jgi:hypothetical protein
VERKGAPDPVSGRSIEKPGSYLYLPRADLDAAIGWFSGTLATWFEIGFHRSLLTLVKISLHRVLGTSTAVS